jgi:NAD(P)-dependent dehydrogenase (short-subunit alcohol dehydrogenase family)
MLSRGARACATCGAVLAVLIGLLFSGALARLGVFRAVGSRVPRFLGLTPAFSTHPWSCTHEQIAAYNLTGQRALVTGANSGLGLETAIVLAKLGASVALACRSPAKCRAAADDVRSTAAHGADVSTWTLDTSSLASVRAFAADFLAASDAPLDMFFQNAGVASAGVWAAGSPTLPLSVDGIEAVFAANHVGHALLYGLLEARLRAAPVARVVLTSSASHFDTYSYGVATDLATLNSPLERSGAAILNPYGQSKLVQILWAQEATRRLALENVSSVYVNALHPGMVDTGIWGANPILSDGLKTTVVAYLQRHMMWSRRDGALTMLWLGVATDALVARDIRGLYYHPQCERVEPFFVARNETLQREVWRFTEELAKMGP